jgi:hypothetical protein
MVNTVTAMAIDHVHQLVRSLGLVAISHHIRDIIKANTTA